MPKRVVPTPADSMRFVLCSCGRWEKHESEGVGWFWLLEHLAVDHVSGDGAAAELLRVGDT